MDEADELSVIEPVLDKVLLTEVLAVLLLDELALVLALLLADELALVLARRRACSARTCV